MTLMWEAKAAAGQADVLLDWVLRSAAPDAEVYRGADGRVVVIGTAALPEPPAALLARPVHTWRFERVR